MTGIGAIVTIVVLIIFMLSWIYIIYLAQEKYPRILFLSRTSMYAFGVFVGVLFMFFILQLLCTQMGSPIWFSTIIESKLFQWLPGISIIGLFIAIIIDAYNSVFS